MTSFNTAKPVALFVVFEDETGNKYEAHIPEAQVGEIEVGYADPYGYGVGETSWTFRTRGQWSITKFGTHVRRKHIKE